MSKQRRKIRERLFRLSQDCAYCNRRLYLDTLQSDPAKATLDHIVPLDSGGSHKVENMALACPRCKL